MFLIFPPVDPEAERRRTASEVAGVCGTSTAPLTYAARSDNYHRQSGHTRPLTARQWRRLDKKLGRAEAYAAS